MNYILFSIGLGIILWFLGDEDKNDFHTPQKL